MAAAPGAKTAPGAVQEGGFTFQYTPSTGPARAVVLLLGWTGCEDKYLAKYSAVHAELGIASLRTTASTWDIYMDWKRLYELGVAGLAAASKTAGTLQCPLLVHCFSNGGFIPMVMVGIHAAAHPGSQPAELLGKVQGWILDSCPGRLSVEVAARSLTEGMPTGCTRSAANALLHGLLCLAFSCMGSGWQDEYWAGAAELPSQAPQLFLYSSADTLTGAGELEGLMARREQRGVPLHAVRFGSSPHVSHLRSNPQAYRSAIQVLLAASSGASDMAESAAQGILGQSNAQGLLREGVAGDAGPWRSGRLNLSLP